MSSARVAACAVLVVLVLAPACATSQSPFANGSHLRLTPRAPDFGRITGRFRLLSSDSILITPDSDSTAIVPFATADIDRLEVERDGKTREQATTVMGVVGAGAGLTAAVLWCKNNQAACEEDIDQMLYAAENDSTYIGPSLLMILGGTAIGALIGYALAPAPHWDLVAFPTRTSTNDGSPRMLFNVGLRYSFGDRRR